MPLVIPTGFAQASIELRSDFDTEPWYVTFGVSLADAGGDFPAAALSVQTAFEEAYQSILSSQVTMSGVNLLVGQDGGAPVNIRVNRSEVGASGAEKLPQNCAALVSKGTARGGRPGKGRYFLPGTLNEGQVSQTGVMSSSELTAHETAANTLLFKLEAPTDPLFPSVPMVLLHNLGVPGGTTPSVVTSLTVSALIATQRRRLRR